MIILFCRFDTFLSCLINIGSRGLKFILKHKNYSLNRLIYSLLLIFFIISYSYFLQIINIFLYDLFILNLVDNYYEYQSQTPVFFQVIRKSAIRNYIFILFCIYFINITQIIFQYTIGKKYSYFHCLKKILLLPRFNKSKYKDSLGLK